jgi:hypothetical protein
MAIAIVCQLLPADATKCHSKKQWKIKKLIWFQKAFEIN